MSLSRRGTGLCSNSSTKTPSAVILARILVMQFSGVQWSVRRASTCVNRWNLRSPAVDQRYRRLPGPPDRKPHALFGKFRSPMTPMTTDWSKLFTVCRIWMDISLVCQICVPNKGWHWAVVSGSSTAKTSKSPDRGSRTTRASRRSVHVISSSQLRHPLSRLRMSVSTSFLSVGPQRHEQSTCHQIGHQHPGLGKSWAPFPAVIKSWIYGMRAVEATKRELVQRVPRSLPLKIAESPATITARSWQVIIVPRTMHFVVTLPSLFTTILWSFHS